MFCVPSLVTALVGVAGLVQAALAVGPKPSRIIRR